jgi:hypothetical protein
MSPTQSGQVFDVRDRRGDHDANPADDVHLPYTQPPPSVPNAAKYPPQHSERGVPPIPHGIRLNHDPEQARFRMPPDFSESSINLLKPKTDHPSTSKVRVLLMMMNLIH